MKNIYKIGLGIGIMLFTLISCTEDPVSSKVTFYPELTINGESTVVLTEGDTYTEEGAVALENGEEIEVTTTGTVDSSTPGVYFVSYAASNVDGFATSKKRTVIVLSAEPSAINLEGTFFRNGNPNNIIRLDDRVYQCDNAGGTVLDDPKILLKATFYNVDDQIVYIPFQENASPSGLSIESNIGNIVDENSFTWTIYALPTYGTGPRIFTR